MPMGASGSGVEETTQGSGVFWLGAVYTFLMVSRTVEFIDGSGQLHLTFILGLACIIALISTGLLPKMLISTQGKWMNLFCFWVFVGLPFSTWKGGSVHAFPGWFKSYLTFLIVGGLIFTLKQYRTITVILALSTISQIYLAYRNKVNAEEDRLAVTYGSLGNANDLASALLIGLPFILFAMSDKKVNPLLRILCPPLLIALLVAVLKTGSRGGLVAMAILLMVAFVKSHAAGKMKIIVGGIAIAAMFAMVVPSDMRTRYLTIFKNDRTALTVSALDSSTARKELLTNAFLLTLRHPVFGVGLAQFSPQSFNLFVSRGVVGMWFTCHDIFGLVSSETGIPGLIFFCGIIVSSFRLLSRLAKVEKSTPELELISRMSNTLLMSLVAYVACGIFNTQAYTHQLPVLAALTAALDRISAPYLAAAGPVQRAPMPAPYVNRRLAQRTAQAVS